MLLAPDGNRWVAPLYDLATGLAYDSATVDRRVALSIGGERIVSRIRRKQWDKAAILLGLPADRLVDRVRSLAAQYPDAFEKALAAVADVPGAEEVAARTVPELRKHCRSLLQRLR